MPRPATAHASATCHQSWQPSRRSLHLLADAIDRVARQTAGVGIRSDPGLGKENARAGTDPDFRHRDNGYVGVIVTYNTEGETKVNSFEHLIYDALIDAMDAAWKAADAANTPVDEPVREAA